MIKIDGVTKVYTDSKQEKICVLDNVSFDVKEGELVALLGANGSGKSTLIKCICGVIKPSKGAVFVDNKNVYKERKKLLHSIGVLFNQKPSFIVDLSVEENLKYYKSVYGIDNKTYNDNLLFLDTFLSFQSLLDKPYRKLSFGERIKCEIVSILLHSPKYLYFDEPTIGLDYGVKKGFYELLATLKEKGTTILMTTHEVDYIQEICDQVVIMDAGKVVYNERGQNFLHTFSITPALIVSYKKILDNKKYEQMLHHKNIKKGEALSLIISYENNKQKGDLLKNIVEAVDVIRIEELERNVKEILKDVIQKNN